MIDIYKVILLVLISVLFSACAADDEKNIEPLLSGLTICEDPRPQICTREYNPVCATYKDASKKTGATGCSACSDPEVIGYIMGACETAAVD